jgi:hypothetical protein
MLHIPSPEFYKICMGTFLVKLSRVSRVEIRKRAESPDVIVLPSATSRQIDCSVACNGADAGTNVQVLVGTKSCNGTDVPKLTLALVARLVRRLTGLQRDLPATNSRLERRIQPVDATSWLNRSAGVS